MCLLSNLNSLAKPQEPRIMQFSLYSLFILCFQTKSFNGKILENKLKIHKIYIGKSPFTFFGTQFKCIYADETNWKRDSGWENVPSYILAEQLGYVLAESLIFMFKFKI